MGTIVREFVKIKKHVAELKLCWDEQCDHMRFGQG